MTLPANLTLERLLEGNRRFVEDRSTHPHEDAARRLALRSGQHPHTAVLTCADSRVVPELIFDQGLGDLFCVRVAGNIVDDAILGSVEYAVVHLGVKLVVVLGHEGCGAVAAAIAGDETELHIDELVRAIRPAVERARARGGDLEQHTVLENALQSARLLRESEDVLAGQIQDHGLLIVPAVYSLHTGAVELIEPERGAL